MVARDPLFSIRLRTSSDSRTIGVWFLASNIDLLGWSSGALTTPLLLREVWNDPDGVEKVANSAGAC